MPPEKVACMTHNVTGLWALEAVKRLEVAIGDPFLVDTVCTSKAWVDVMKRYFDTLAAGEVKPVPEEEV
jgi:hypothetical protein